MKFVFISDFFADEVLGGGEINNEELAILLRSRGHSVIEEKSTVITEEAIAEYEGYCFIVGNFINLAEGAKRVLKQVPYIIYEHDHKYLSQRNPALYKNYVAPESEIINKDFYRHALGVFCQSDFHCKIVQKNLHIDNIKNLAGNLWSEETLKYIEELLPQKKEDGFSIMHSPIVHKNTAGAIRYCESQNAPYTLVASNNYHEFLKQLSERNKFVFLPRTPETLSRIVVEARMLGAEVHTNSRVGASSEDWFSLKGQRLIDKMRERRSAIVDAVESIFVNFRCTRYTPPKKNPKISLLTSLYKGGDHIEDFLRNITTQSVFEDCELIIIDANSPGSEKKIIDRYIDRHPNIIYKRLDSDPGIYGCWNVALELSSGEFISSANIDDRRSLQQLEIFVNELINNPSVDLVYSDCFATHQPNETYSLNSSGGELYPTADFSPENMVKSLPGCMPLWRRTMHDKAGSFNKKYKFAGDWEMWLRAVKAGAQFKRVEGVHGLYYFNPTGLSTDKSREKEKFAEEKSIFHEYGDLFGQKNYNQYKEYFS